MRQSRLVLMAVGGVLLLCVLALVVTFADYTSNPAVADAHVPPVVGTPAGGSSATAPSPVPTIPITTDTATPDAATPSPAAPQRARFVPPMTVAQLIQQFQQRRHHH